MRSSWPATGITNTPRLEHLLLALMDDADAGQVMKACNVDTEALRRAVQKYVDEELVTLVIEDGEEAKPTTGIPARGPARGPACPEFGPRRSDRRECAGRAVHRTREPRRLFPARAEHEPAGCGELYQPRHRQAPGDEPAQAGARRRRRGRAGKTQQAGHRRAGSLLRQSERKGQVGPRRSPDRPRRRSRAHHPNSLPPPEEQPVVRRRSRRGQDRHRRRAGAQDRQQ